MNAAIPEEAKTGWIQVQPLPTTQLADWLAAGENVFALLDACDEPLVPPLVSALEDRAVSLYRGAAAIDHAAYAPYAVDVDTKVVEWITENLATKPWGYFVVAEPECTLAEIRRHFRNFLLVKGPNDEQLYFRFYDPRLLETFLQSSTVEEVAAFFGPIQIFALLDSSQVVALSPISR